jgi:hypothetical protein
MRLPLRSKEDLQWFSLSPRPWFAVEVHRFPAIKLSMSLSRRSSPGEVDILTRFNDIPMEWQSMEDDLFIGS